MTDVNYEVQKIHAIENVSKKHFGIDLRVKKIIASDITTGSDVFTTLFKDDTGTIYTLSESDTDMTLSDVMTMVKAINLEATGYLAPHRDSNYFTKRGREAYSAVFPGRDISQADITYYQTLSSYNPALVKIARINGDLRSYNTVSSQWRKEYEESYIKEVSNE